MNYRVDSNGYERSTPDAAKFIAKRSDKNQPNIVGTFRKMGFSVQSLHETGRGVFDLIIAKQGLNVFVEVKNGKKSPSARTLTPPQKRWHFGWTGMRCIVTCEEEAVSVAGQINDMLRAIQGFGLKLEVIGNTEAQYQPGLYA